MSKRRLKDGQEIEIVELGTEFISNNVYKMFIVILLHRYSALLRYLLVLS